MKEKIHDKGYKRVLSKKVQFIHLLKKYVMEDWNLQISEDDLELIDKQFVPRDFKDKEADIIYKIKLQDRELIFYVLLELQSSVDYTMPFRLLVYMTELQKRLFLDVPVNIRRKSDFHLPPIVPIVFYNGENAWKVAPSYSEYTLSHELEKEYALEFRYLLLDLNKKSKDLLTCTNRLLDNVFILDQAQDLNQLKLSLELVVRRLKALNKDEQNDLMDWIRDVLLKKVKDKKEVKNVLEVIQKGDVRDMTYSIERIFDKEYSKGLEDGVQKGLEKGLEVVAINMLKKGTDIQEIKECTGLSLGRIQELQVKIELK